MDLATLPDEALLEVLSYLDIDELLECRAVCRRLRDAALHPHLWRKRRLLQNYNLKLTAATLRLAPCLGRLTLDSERCRGLLASTSCAVSELHMELRATNGVCLSEALARQAALGQVNAVSLNLGSGDKIADTRMLLDQLLHTRGLTSISLQVWASAKCCPKPSSDVRAVPSSLQRLQYRWMGGPLSYLSSLLRTHADTLQVVDFGDFGGRPPAGTAVLLGALPNLRELKCTVMEDMPALLRCPALKTVSLLVVNGTRSPLEPRILGAQQYIRQAVADRLEALTLDFFPEYMELSTCEDLVLCLAGPGSGAPSALRSLRLTYGDGYGSGGAQDPQPQLPPLASVLPRLENLVSLDLGGPHTAAFLEAMDGQVLPRLERLRFFWPLRHGCCPHKWAHGQEARGLLMRYHPRLHLELESEHDIDSYTPCDFCEDNGCHVFEGDKVHTLFSHPEHDGQCQQEHRRKEMRIVW